MRTRTPIAVAICFAWFCSGMCLHVAHAQSSGTSNPPSFEVTSIKRDMNEATMIRLGGPDVSRFIAANVTVKDLIEFSYDVRDFQVSGGPDWISAEKFDVDGKVEDSAAEQMRALSQIEQQKQERLMVQSMLADRFKLVVNHQTKTLPIFALFVAKGGPKLKEVAAPDPQSSAPFPGPPRPDDTALPPGEVLLSLGVNGKAAVAGKAAPIGNLVRMLAVLLGRQVDDDTGLKGTYDFLVSYTRDSALDAGPIVITPDRGAVQTPGGMSLFTALQEQLGLKLESTKGLVDTVAIVHIEEPSAN